MKRDEFYMRRCLELAARGKGYVSPNPLVGSVLVKNGSIVGEGYHARFGGPHAEVLAIQNASRDAKGATLYVNLEPCPHYGKTPPCTEAILSSGIRRVVVGMIDPNPIVRGKGVRLLRAAGIKVEVGVLSEECEKANEFFLKKSTQGLPFVAIKIAQTLDGKIAQPSGQSRWITSVASRRYVHQLRAEYDAVLIGAATAKLDNPQLTVRLARGRHPRRILLDGNLSTPLSCKLFTDENRSRTTVYCRENGDARLERKKGILRRQDVEVVDMTSNGAGQLDVKGVLGHLAKTGIISVLVEGGQKTFTGFLSAGVVDKAYFFVAPKLYGCKGLPAIGELPKTALKLNPATVVVQGLGDDTLIEGYFRSPSMH